MRKRRNYDEETFPLLIKESKVTNKISFKNHSLLLFVEYLNNQSAILIQVAAAPSVVLSL